MIIAIRETNAKQTEVDFLVDLSHLGTSDAVNLEQVTLILRRGAAAALDCDKWINTRVTQVAVAGTGKFEVTVQFDLGLEGVLVGAGVFANADNLTQLLTRRLAPATATVQ